MNLKAKTAVWLLSFFVFSNSLKSQSASDAISYGKLEFNGSARVIGMGGTMLAIGTDPTATLVNPAGLGNFKRGEFQISLGYQTISSSTNFFNNSLVENSSKVTIPNINLTSVRLRYDMDGKPKKDGIVSSAFNFGVNKVASFNEKYAFSGTNNINSITDYFAFYANGLNATPQSVEPGYLEYHANNTGAITWLPTQSKYAWGYDGNTADFLQQGSLKTTGAIYRYSVGGGLNISNDIQFGANFHYNTLRKTSVLDFRETDLLATRNRDLQKVLYRRGFEDKGGGLGLDFGIIFKLFKATRIGASFNSSVSYNITTSFTDDVSVILDPNASTVYKSLRSFTEPANTFTYNVATPSRLNIGIHHRIKKLAMINVELTRTNFSTTNIFAKDDDFLEENQAIKQTYGTIYQWRFGAEYNLPTKKETEITYRIRGGLQLNPSPFSKTIRLNNNFDKTTFGLSSGIGLIAKTSYIDFGFLHTISQGYYLPYATNAASSPQGIKTKLGNTQILITGGLKF